MSWRPEVQRRYDRIAASYDAKSRLPNLVGFRDRHVHRVAVDMLAPEPGSTVWVPGCGTGIDFPRLQRHIGAHGRIVGVDLSEGMLAQAEAKVDEHGWENVELHHGDHLAHGVPPGTDHVLASFTLKFNPAFRNVIEAAHEALPSDGRMAIADFWLPRVVRPLGQPLLRPFAHTHETLDRRPDLAMAQVFGNQRRRRFWFGWAFAVVSSRLG